MSFELSKVERKFIRERQLGILANIDETLAARVAENIGLPEPKKNASAEELGKSSLKELPMLSESGYARLRTGVGTSI